MTTTRILLLSIIVKAARLRGEALDHVPVSYTHLGTDSSWADDYS